jgi:hypothetical protein
MRPYTCIPSVILRLFGCLPPLFPITILPCENHGSVLQVLVLLILSHSLPHAPAAIAVDRLYVVAPTSNCPLYLVVLTNTTESTLLPARPLRPPLQLLGAVDVASAVVRATEHVRCFLVLLPAEAVHHFLLSLEQQLFDPRQCCFLRLAGRASRHVEPRVWPHRACPGLCCARDQYARGQLAFPNWLRRRGEQNNRAQQQPQILQQRLLRPPVTCPPLLAAASSRC